MVFIGIIEQNKDAIQDIAHFFLHREDYSLLFICQNLDDYRALPFSKKSKAGIIFIDPGETYIDRLWQIKYLRQVNPATNIILLSDAPVEEYISSKMLQAGASRFVQKQAIAKSLETYFLKEPGSMHPMKGGKYIEHVNGHSPEPAGASAMLTTREFEIVEMVLKGYTNKKISELMYISIYTVNAHLRKVYIKLSVKSRIELMSRIFNDLV